MKVRFILLLFILWFEPSEAKIWQVGSARTYKFCSQVSTLVQNGDTIDIDTGIYTNDVQVAWTKNNLLIRGVNGKPVLIAGSIIANDKSNGKGIFVIDGTNTTIENIEFRDCKVQSLNGAGIRIENSNVKVRQCVFNGNEMGILAGGTIPNCTVLVEYSEFLNGGSVANPGYQHNIYINHIDSFIFRFNYSHDAIAEGHELKSRASFNFIAYNRLANISTVDSRTIDLPNGGTTIVMGNVIEQGLNSSNSNLLGYGLEGLINAAPHNLWIVSNTFVNKKDKGSFVQIAATGVDTLLLVNNILAGPRTGGLLIGAPAFLDSSNNLVNDNLSVMGFQNSTSFNYHLITGSIAIDQGKALNKKVYSYSLIPTQMYVDSLNKQLRPLVGPIDIGAFEFGSSTGLEMPPITNQIHIYPNPCSSTFYVEGEVINIKLYNLKGEEIPIEERHKNEWNMNFLPRGYYLLKVEQNMGATFHKILLN